MPILFILLYYTKNYTKAYTRDISWFFFSILFKYGHNLII